jgi:chaperonin GroES
MNDTTMNSMAPDLMAQDETQSQATEEGTTESKLRKMIESVNIAETLDEQKLKDIGQAARQGYDTDLGSRTDWEDDIENWTKLAVQCREDRTWPWPNASNVKYPLLSTAANQFAARAYPALVPSDGRVVKAKPIGKDPDGNKLAVAERVSIYMSYQLLHEMYGWEDDMDKLLIMLPIVGTVFKKTYWDTMYEKPCSNLVLPKDLVVNYWSKNLREAERISQYIEMSPRVLKQRQLDGVFLDVDLGNAPTPESKDNAPANDETTPYAIIEQHTYIDLDEDGYPEPYIVTFHMETGTVLRIAARFDVENTKFNDDGDVVYIEPIHYFTKFGFLPNPDGGFYDIGFGTLLGPLNEAVNSLINQLIDSGTLNNLQGGFLGKGLRLRMGDQQFKPGEWKTMNAVGDDLRKQIVPLPTKEPSDVLFQLMGSLITSGKELASVAEIFTGKMPGQNTPATTTMATIEQGMKVFTAVYKRIYRSLHEEFNKLFYINKTYINPGQYAAVVDMEVSPDDFDEDLHQVFPGADPNAISQTERLMKAQGLLELVAVAPGVLNPIEVIKRVLEAQEQPNWQQLFTPEVLQSGQLPPPPPDPKMLEMQMKSDLEQKKFQMQGAATQQKMELEAASEEAKLAMKSQEHAMDMQQKAQLNQVEAATAIHKQRIFSAESAMKLNQQSAEGAQKLQQKKAEHQQKLKQQPKKGSS